MSGRSGFRKTNVKRSRRIARVDLSLTFTLPPSLSAFVTAGNYGGGLSVEAFGYVRVIGRDTAAVIRRAQEFLASIAKDHPPLCLSATLVRHGSPLCENAAFARPTATRYQIAVASGHPVVMTAKANLEPSLFVR